METPRARTDGLSMSRPADGEISTDSSASADESISADGSASGNDERVAGVGVSAAKEVAAGLGDRTDGESSFRTDGESSFRTAGFSSPAAPTYINNTVLSPPHAHAGDAPLRAGFGVYAAALCLVLGVVFVVAQRAAASAPYKNLRAYVNTEVASRPVRGIGELVVDDYALYAQSVCVRGEDVETVRRGLRANLKVPVEVREEVIRSAVVEKLSCTNSMQNTTASLAQDGKALSYMAYWSTEYVGEAAVFAPKYTTCVMCAGISLSVGEELSGFEERTDAVLVGSEPCRCGWLRCEQCPVFKERETKTPIFKRNKLTLQGQIDLHRFMEASAFKSAMALVGAEQGGLGEILFGKRAAASPLVESWKAPNSNVFLGTPPPDSVVRGGDDVIRKEEL